MSSEPNKLPPFKDCPNVAKSVNTEVVTSDTGLVMDVTKTETWTTMMKCSRDKVGKLRYRVKKQLQVEMEGIVDDSPGLCDRIREDSVAQDFILEESFTNKLPQLELVEPKKEDPFKTKGSSGEKGTLPKKKKKQMEKVHEESEAKTSEVILTRGKERLSGSSLTGPTLAASLSNASSDGNADKFPAGVRISTSLLELPKVRHSQVCLSPNPIEFEIQLAVESLPVSLSNGKCLFDKGTTARDHDAGALPIPSADHLQEKTSQVISTAERSKISSEGAESSVKTARMQSPASVNTIATDNSADKKKYPTSVDAQGFGSYVRPASLLPLLSRRVKPTVGFCDAPHGTKSVTSGKLDFKSCLSFAKDPLLGKNSSEKGKEEVKAIMEQPKVATGQPQQQFEEIPDGLLEQMVTVQSSVPKLSAAPQTVAAPFENVPTLKSENGKVAHNKSSTALKEGTPNVTCGPFVSQATGDPEVDQLLEQIKQRPLASKCQNEQSHFERHVRFYVNQEKLFAKMHELLPVPEDLARKESKPENKEQLLEWQRNLMKREEAFVGQVNSSNSLATFLNTPNRPLQAVIDQQQPVVTDGSNGNPNPLFVILIFGIALAVSLLSTLF